MKEIRLIDVKQEILADNTNLANEIREELKREKVLMFNLMASPGSGKTSLILESAKRLKGQCRIGVIEGDIESSVDSEKIAAADMKAVQLRTGGICHLDASMIRAALDSMKLDDFDMIVVENIGNLVCPAEFDIGESLKVMILSVPEGDDKILKYPMMFSICDALVINKIDYLGLSDFNIELLKERAKKLNPKMRVFEVSCRTGEGLEAWCAWLVKKHQEFITN